MEKKIVYTIERLKRPDDFSPEIKQFLLEEVPKLSKTCFGDSLDVRNCSPFMMARDGLVLFGKRNGEVRGMVVASFLDSWFDPKLTILYQQTLFVKPDSGRMLYHLFKKFIDIGRLEANHIITMLTSQTNIKPETLERMGFKELETLYRMEV